ncbi:hypothetical protein CXB45_11030 [Corynebacterium mastitidis]|uniref:Uncharacterized protein n=1 Tax=Corynebacterium mastitidis TaxID=161890 RepID=A0A2N0X4P9_9CORY|nr:hypothetical protein CXB45_11030 [Corynebacterium mastitidis]
MCGLTEDFGRCSQEATEGVDGARLARAAGCCGLEGSSFFGGSFEGSACWGASACFADGFDAVFDSAPNAGSDTASDAAGRASFRLTGCSACFFTAEAGLAAGLCCFGDSSPAGLTLGHTAPAFALIAAPLGSSRFAAGAAFVGAACGWPFAGSFDRADSLDAPLAGSSLARCTCGHPLAGIFFFGCTGWGPCFSSGAFSCGSG